jgi:hypothetical protein
MVPQSLKSLAVLIGAACTMCSSFAQEAAVHMSAPPLAFKIDWIRPPSQENTKVRYTPVQERGKLHAVFRLPAPKHMIAYRSFGWRGTPRSLPSGYLSVRLG